MWEDILKNDTVLDLISKFIFIETKESKDELTGKTKKSENVIFPRYHQLDVIRKLLADVRENGSTQNYLIQHSAGFGKTNSILWLAHRLTSLHDADNKIIFDNVVIVTDRVVIGRQIQKAIMGMEHKAGLTQAQYDVHTLHSGNLYQIFTYVKNKDTEFGDEPHRVSGMLLYAATDEAIQPDNSYRMSGNQISVKTLDLNRDFSEIAAQLNEIVDKHFG